MSPCSTDIDPYAELDNRADAAELSDEYRMPVAVRRRRPVTRILAQPGRRRV
ncbi:hypothetical protein [Devosia sp. Root685]|uniref:hypothetical protein n=1 Tax=Devosia sp. Root685 TaxID=1736587 RepID=UPI000A6836E5|nr:hypothetical protein [Devosia sp. Root685]